MLPLTKKELKLHQDAIICYIWGKISWSPLSLPDHCQVNTEVQYIVYHSVHPPLRLGGVGILEFWVFEGDQNIFDFKGGGVVL